MIDITLSDNSNFVFNINKLGNNIAIQFSGGIESTLLLYLIVTELKKNRLNKNYCAYIFNRYNNPIQKAENLLRNIEKIVNDKIIYEKVNLPTMTNLKLEGLVTRHYMAKKGHDMIVTGIQQPPSDPLIRPNYNIDLKEYIGVLYAPLWNLQKHHTIEIYYKLNIEFLLPYTHSCGSNQEEPCMKCFNCIERIWGYEKLGMVPNMGI